jgi:predicted alpha/beta-hydrolase family hydrolase
VRGLVFLGFPLHPAGRPSDDRATHLFDVHLPMLFLQGTRDALARPDLMEPLVGRLGARATLHQFQEADHSFHVPARTRRTDAAVRSELLDDATAWVRSVLARPA